MDSGYIGREGGTGFIVVERGGVITLCIILLAYKLRTSVICNGSSMPLCSRGSAILGQQEEKLMHPCTVFGMALLVINGKHDTWSPREITELLATVLWVLKSEKPGCPSFPCFRGF